MWREKLLAFSIHFLVTLLLAAAAAVVIFFIWFPNPFQTMMGGTELFLLIVGCDLALGPLISLVIYNSKKSRKELILDYAVVGVVQLTALIYGVYVMSGSRPVYVVHSKDRLEVVTPLDLEQAELEAATEERFRSVPKWGPVLVATSVPPEEANDALFTALGGKAVSVRPRYFIEYEAGSEQVIKNSQPLSALEKSHPQAKQMIAAAKAELGLPESQLAWMPVQLKQAFWTAIIDTNTGYPLKYLELDPY